MDIVQLIINFGLGVILGYVLGTGRYWWQRRSERRTSEEAGR